MRAWLDEVAGRCPVCVAMWRERGGTWAWRRTVEHGIEQCPRFDDEKYRQWRHKVNFGEFQCCWECGLPQSFCDGWDGFGPCEWGDKMMPVVWWVTQHRGWRKMTEQRFEVVMEPWDDDQEGWYIRWVGRARRMYDENVTNAVAIWDMVIQETQKVKRP